MTSVWRIERQLKFPILPQTFTGRGWWVCRTTKQENILHFFPSDISLWSVDCRPCLPLYVEPVSRSAAKINFNFDISSLKCVEDRGKGEKGIEMEVKNVLACLWFLTFAATEIKGEVVCFVHINVYVFYIGHYRLVDRQCFPFHIK